MFRVKNNTIPETFRTKFQIVQHNYATRHSENNFEETKTTLKTTKFAISSPEPHLWNKHTDSFVKTITSALDFNLRNVTNYFYLIKLLTRSCSVS